MSLLSQGFGDGFWLLFALAANAYRQVLTITPDDAAVRRQLLRLASQ